MFFKTALLAAFMTWSIALPCAATVSIIQNGGFESGVLGPWYEDRASGSTRPWGVTSIRPYDGERSAFNLGRLELRQDFAPVSASDILTARFAAARQGTSTSNDILAEWFYTDGTSSGALLFVITTAGSGSTTIWQQFDLLPFLDPAKTVRGLSFTGVPDVTTKLDGVVVTAVPEPNIMAVAAWPLPWMLRRRRTHQP